MSSRRNKKSREVDDNYDEEAADEDMEEQEDEEGEGSDGGDEGEGESEGDEDEGGDDESKGQGKGGGARDPMAADSSLLDKHDRVRSFPFGPASLTPLAQQHHLEHQGWKGKRELVQLMCPLQGGGNACDACVTYFYAVDESLAGTYTARLSAAQLRNNKNIEKAWSAHQPHCVSLPLRVHLPRALRCGTRTFVNSRCSL